MNKSTSLFVVGLLAGLLLASAGYAWVGSRHSSKSRMSAAARVLRVGHGLPPSHPVHHGLEFMARRAEELSGGRLKLEVFPGEQLGTETQCLEQVQAGTLAITKTSSGVIGNFVTTYKVFGLPYLFRDGDHLWSVLTGTLGRELLDLLAVGNDGQPSGLTGLCFYDAGSRSFYTKSAIQGPEDLKGKKIRTMNDPVSMEVISAMGGAPTPIAWGELYTALQQGVVDGAENNPPSLLTSRHYEVCKYYTLDHHTRLPDVLVISSKVWARLPAEEQQWLRQASEESSAFQRKLWAEESAKAIEQLKRQGVQVNEVQSDSFRQASRPVLEKYSVGNLKPLVERIQEVK